MSKASRKAKNQPQNLFFTIENIVALAEDSGFNKEFFKAAKEPIEELMKHLGLSLRQVVLLSLFIDQYHRSRITLESIASHVGCRPIRLLAINDDIETLVTMGYIRKKHSNDSTSYRVPKEVIEALKNNQAYQAQPIVIKDTHELLGQFSILLDRVDDDELSHEELCEAVDGLLEQIPTSTLTKKLKSYDISSTERCIFILMTQLLYEDDDEQVGSYDISKLFPDKNMPTGLKREFQKRSLSLFHYKLIEPRNEDGIKSPEYVKLSDFAKEEILSELILPQKDESRLLLHPDKIDLKTLIYNPKEAEQIEELSSILGEEYFRDVQTRLKESGMRTGFCCLFYGSPGTGKTETVYQLAKQTGRAIFSINVEQIMNCYVGESEKNIKRAFNRYRNLCESERLAPILLFNEADAIFGKRSTNVQASVDQMRNSIQNIILQEMETLEGILIATTNLTSNLDKAFERRFLYKIEFQRPTFSARSQIWQAMLGGLGKEEAQTLAEEFDFSGGQIENIVRKHTVKAILSGESKIELEMLRSVCQQELITKGQHNKVGF